MIKRIRLSDRGRGVTNRAEKESGARGLNVSLFNFNFSFHHLYTVDVEHSGGCLPSLADILIPPRWDSRSQATKFGGDIKFSTMAPGTISHGRHCHFG
jgi:hypothetical protein